MKILLIGSGAREHALARALEKSIHSPTLVCFGSSNNPGIKELAADYATGNLDDVAAIIAYVKANAVDWAIVGPELPLSVGVVDALAAIGIPAVGPTKKLAQIETSKSFTRDLFTEYAIPGCAKYKKFSSLEGVDAYARELNDNYVVKADGLMGGKGVKVYGEHLNSLDETLAWCNEIISSGNTFLIEEKFVGQEFSLMSFSDGKNVVHMPAVQDHKRAFVGDTGPNTGGMGSYSDANFSLPFLTPEDITQAQHINELTIKALHNKFGVGYKGILYGGFMATADSVKIIEYNARFGDPEAINVLSIFQSDFVEVCEAIIKGNLKPELVKFGENATVCKYAVPEGYPDNPVKNQPLDISAVENPYAIYYAAVDAREDGLYETGSRAVAVIGIADTIARAEASAEAEIKRIKGPLFHREDVGTEGLIEKRVEMMKSLRTKTNPRLGHAYRQTGG